MCFLVIYSHVALPIRASFSSLQFATFGNAGNFAITFACDGVVSSESTVISVTSTANFGEILVDMPPVVYFYPPSPPIKLPEATGTVVLSVKNGGTGLPGKYLHVSLIGVAGAQGYLRRQYPATLSSGFFDIAITDNPYSGGTDNYGVGIWKIAIAAAQNGTYFLEYNLDGVKMNGAPFQIVNNSTVVVEPGSGSCSFVRPISVVAAQIIEVTGRQCIW